MTLKQDDGKPEIGFTGKELLRMEEYVRHRPALAMRAKQIVYSPPHVLNMTATVILKGLPEGVRDTLNKFPLATRLFGWLDQHIDNEEVLKRLQDYWDYATKENMLHKADSFNARFRQAKRGELTSEELTLGSRGVIQKLYAEKLLMSESARTRAMLFLMEYVTDRPNLRGSTIDAIRKTAFRIYELMPAEMLGHIQKNRACEEHYRHIDPWVGSNIDLIKI